MGVAGREQRGNLMQARLLQLASLGGVAERREAAQAAQQVVQAHKGLALLCFRERNRGPQVE